MTNSEALRKQIDLRLLEESHRLHRSYIPQNSRSYACSQASCSNPAYARNLCNAHYIRWRKGKDMDVPVRHTRAIRECTICGLVADRKGGWGLCKKHYNATRRRVIMTACIEFLGGRCEVCQGTFAPVAFDFHHRDPQEKDFSVSDAIAGVSSAAIAAEVVKCALLCANCHRIHHYHQAEVL